jgi:hypothetical protein
MLINDDVIVAYKVEQWQCWVMKKLWCWIMLINDDVNDESDKWNSVVIVSCWWCAICSI